MLGLGVPDRRLKMIAMWKCCCAMMNMFLEVYVSDVEKVSAEPGHVGVSTV